MRRLDWLIDRYIIAQIDLLFSMDTHLKLLSNEISPTKLEEILIIVKRLLFEKTREFDLQLSADDMPLRLIQKCANMFEHGCLNSPAQSGYASWKQELNNYR